MCDFIDEDVSFDRKTLSRRQFAVLGAAVALSSYAPLAAATRKLTEQMVEVKTTDGKADAFFVHPASGSHPGVILWPDALGLRDTKKDMARRLADAGYAVLAVNQYYRNLRAPLGLDFSAFRTDEGRKKLQPAMAGISPEGVMRDASAFVTFLDAQKAVNRKRGIGVQGYCMGGAMTIRSAAAAPARIKAAAIFHGGGLVTDKPDSPHLLLDKTKANYLIAVARDDDAKALNDKDTLRATAQKAGRPAEVEVYAGNHGWCVPDSPSYNQAEAERAWGRLLALYSTL
jgi:carboxymethylenebutenolidase